jgi:hypothetical protein
LTDDHIALFKKRVYDLAGIFNNKVKVKLNNYTIRIRRFENYVDYYLPK